MLYDEVTQNITPPNTQLTWWQTNSSHKKHKSLIVNGEALQAATGQVQNKTSEVVPNVERKHSQRYGVDCKPHGLREPVKSRSKHFIKSTLFLIKSVCGNVKKIPVQCCNAKPEPNNICSSVLEKNLTASGLGGWGRIKLHRWYSVFVIFEYSWQTRTTLKSIKQTSTCVIMFLLDSVVCVWLFSSAPSCWSPVLGLATCCVPAGIQGRFRRCGQSSTLSVPRLEGEGSSPPPVSTLHSSLLYFPVLVYTWGEKERFYFSANIKWHLGKLVQSNDPRKEVCADQKLSFDSQNRLYL